MGPVSKPVGAVEKAEAEFEKMGECRDKFANGKH